MNFQQSTTHIHEVGVIVDKLNGDIPQPLGAVHASGGDQAEGEVQDTGGNKAGGGLLLDSRLL